MPSIEAIRPVLLSAPYANEESFVVQRHLPNGYRTCGSIEITLDDGTKGIGESYLAKFAPSVFTSIAEFLIPSLLGTAASDVQRRYDEMVAMTSYWSREGAARQVISGLEIALVDAVAKHLEVPAYTLFGGKRVDTLGVYGSGGEGTTKAEMIRELDALSDRGVDVFKIRAIPDEISKVSWVLERADELDIAVAIDLMTTGRSPKDVIGFVDEVTERTTGEIAFLEEPLARNDLQGYRILRERLDIPISGGEAVTSSEELVRQLEHDPYDLVQPDATVIGGMHQLLESFTACRRYTTDVVVHCWGGSVCMMANYHAAVSGGGRLVEWPMPAYPLREEMMVSSIEISGGHLELPISDGLGVRLTEDIEEKYPFREEAVFQPFGRGTDVSDDWRP